MSDSVRTMLGQGRGAGFLAALEVGRSASEEVLDCVLSDPRWDRQIEERDDYYAQLLLATGASVECVRRFIVEDPSDAHEADFWLPIGVLAEMSRRGDSSACEALVAGIEFGPHWCACLDALEAVGGSDLIDEVVSLKVVQALVSRVDNEDLADAVNVVAAPWERWAQEVPALKPVVQEGARPDREARPMAGPIAWSAPRIEFPEVPHDLASRSTETLLAHYADPPGVAYRAVKILASRTDSDTHERLVTAAESGTDAQRFVALRVLGIHGCTDFVAAAERYLREAGKVAPEDRRRDRVCVGYLRYLEDLPAAATLLLARRWFAEPWPLSFASDHILERHATHDDREMLEKGGAAALETGEMRRLSSIIDALNTAGPDESIAFLAEVYVNATYSYARRRVVNALNQCRPSRVRDSLLTEALWDCESESRELACRAAHTLSEFPVERLSEIARDPYEDEHVIAAARLTLGGE